MTFGWGPRDPTLHPREGTMAWFGRGFRYILKSGSRGASSQYIPLIKRRGPLCEDLAAGLSLDRGGFAFGQRSFHPPFLALSKEGWRGVCGDGTASQCSFHLDLQERLEQRAGLKTAGRTPMWRSRAVTSHTGVKEPRGDRVIEATAQGQR